MPVIEVKLYDRRVTEESVPKMIEALTQALHESSGAAITLLTGRSVLVSGARSSSPGGGVRCDLRDRRGLRHDRRLSVTAGVAVPLRRASQRELHRRRPRDGGSRLAGMEQRSPDD